MQHLVGTLGHGRERRPALLHPRQRAEPLALDAPRRPPDRRRRWTRSSDKIIDYAAQDQGGRSRRRSSSGPEEWGWSGYFYSGYDQQYGSAARLERPSRSQQPRRRGLSALAARPAAPGQHRAPASACSTSSPSTTTRRAASSATTCRARMQLRRNRSTRSLWDPDLRRRDLDQRQGPADPAPARAG